MLCLRHLMIASRSGMNWPQSRCTSGVQASRSSALSARAALIGHAAIAPNKSAVAITPRSPRIDITEKVLKALAEGK